MRLEETDELTEDHAIHQYELLLVGIQSRAIVSDDLLVGTAFQVAIREAQYPLLFPRKIATQM